MVLAEALAAGVPIVASVGRDPRGARRLGAVLRPGRLGRDRAGDRGGHGAAGSARGARPGAGRDVFVGRRRRAHRESPTRACSRNDDRAPVGDVVLSWNGREDTLACLRSLAEVDWPALDVICVDNGSADGSAGAVREQFPDVTVIENGSNLGYAGGNSREHPARARARRQLGAAPEQRRHARRMRSASRSS